MIITIARVSNSQYLNSEVAWLLATGITLFRYIAKVQDTPFPLASNQATSLASVILVYNCLEISSHTRK